MSVRLPLLALLIGSAAACGRPGPVTDRAPVVDPEPVSTVEPSAAPTTASSTVEAPGLTGREVVEQVCSQCHSMEPPPLAAPPLTHLAAHLRQSFETVDEAVAHVVAYAPAPDAEQSILPSRAVERFGLMPPQPLPEPLLDAATRYIWSLADGEAVMGPRGSRSMRGGRTMPMRRGPGGGGGTL